MEIAVLCVIRNVALEEGDPVPLLRQARDQATPERSMTVAPGGADGKAEDDEPHARSRNVMALDAA